ncbi:hypothetical protein Cyast_0632 [Cyanobacterium stanieri PCC 7202]|uniref:Uncharacterized protein n=1 Tax=Cyanobacterium stanieri (strain ATCC 29140 / PCC 7202) TaxID=292563 RepID=K9YKI0_CYASC|nr:hypothetical protein Cyast_0632 [Cyanobacterium stanieri PCC 7202]
MNMMKVFSLFKRENKEPSMGTNNKEKDSNSLKNQESSRSTFLSKIAENFKDNILDLR